MSLTTTYLPILLLELVLLLMGLIGTLLTWRRYFEKRRRERVDISCSP